MDGSKVNFEPGHNFHSENKIKQNGVLKACNTVYTNVSNLRNGYSQLGSKSQWPINVVFEVHKITLQFFYGYLKVHVMAETTVTEWYEFGMN